MARTSTLLQLRTRIRQRADLVNNNFCTDIEINDYINTDTTELYDLLVAAYEDYFVNTSTLTTDGTNYSYALATAPTPVMTNFYKLMGIDRLLSSGATIPLRKWNWRERSKRAISSEYPRYRLQGDNIEFKIVPTGGLTLQIYWIPTCPLLVADIDTFDGVNGWEEIVVLNGAIKCLNKKEQDPTALINERNDMRNRIIKMAEDRDSGENDRMIDIQFRRRYPDSSLPPDEWEW